MMRRRVLWMLLLLWAMPAFARSLLQDAGFSQGVEVVDPHPMAGRGSGLRPRIEGILQPPGASGLPVWQLVQWNSRRSLSEGMAAPCGQALWCAEVDDAHGVLKRVRWALSPGEGFDIQLTVDGWAEFAGKSGSPARDNPYRQAGEPWPHLLLSQSLRTRSLADYRSLPLSFEARLDAHDGRYRAGHDPSIHAAQFLVVLALRNRFTGDFLWLTLPVYDDRWPQSSYGCHKCSGDAAGAGQCTIPQSPDDAGRWACPHDGVDESGRLGGPDTGHLLFQVPSRAFAREPLVPGSWVHHELDLKPWLLAALQAATDQHERGFLFRPEDFGLSSISLGWEVTGLDRASLSLRHLRLDGLRR